MSTLPVRALLETEQGMALPSRHYSLVEETTCKQAKIPRKDGMPRKRHTPRREPDLAVRRASWRQLHLRAEQ